MARSTDDDDDFREPADEYESPPRRKSTRPADEEDVPKRRPVSKPVADDEDERPTKARKAPPRDEDDDDRPPRSNRSEVDDDDEKPARRTVMRKAQGGWEHGKRVNDSTSSFANRLKPSEEGDIIKFLEKTGPYVDYKQHWIDELKGRKSFVCLEGFDDRDCPLCVMGDKPAVRHCFNVALIAPGLEPELKSFEVGIQLFETLRNYASNERTGPLDKHFWEVRKPKKGITAINLVKERDLGDYDITADDLDLSGVMKKLYTAEILDIPTRKELQQLVEDLED